LVSEHKIFSKEQMLDIYRAVNYSMDERADLSFKQEDALKEIKNQIEKTIPSAAGVLEAERQAQLMQLPGFKMGGM
jgi:pheromone shutdown protein TraB